MIEKHMWRPVTSNTTVRPSSRWGHSCCVIGDELVLFGGYAGTFMSYFRFDLHERSMDLSYLQYAMDLN